MVKTISRLKHLAIYLLCLLAFLLRGRADEEVKVPKRIMVVQRLKLGDMICTTPLLRAIKLKYPQSELIIFGSQLNKELLDNNKYFNKHILAEEGIFKNIRKIKREKIDFACIPGTNFGNLAALYLAGVRSIAAPNVISRGQPRQARLHAMLVKLVIGKNFYAGKYMPKEYLKLLKPIGIFSSDTRKDLFYSKTAKQTIDAFLQEQGINKGKDLLVGIAPSAGNKLKIWGSDKFAKLSNSLSQRYLSKVIVLGAGGDKPYVEEMIRKASKNDQIIDTCDLFSIDELKALIAQLNILIGPDTGLIYFAEALGVPTIDITGPVDEKEQPPVGDAHRIIYADVQCRPCSSVFNTARECRNKKNPFVCFKNIAVADVLAQCRDLLENKK